MDRDIEALKIYCPNNKENGCCWIGEIGHVDCHLKECEISCGKCNQKVFNTIKGHLDTDCPCYCPYCDTTAEREVINKEHKEKFQEYPITCSAYGNIVVIDASDNPDKFDKTNKTQNEQFYGGVNEILCTLVKLQKDVITMQYEVAQSLQVAKENSDKIDKHNTELKPLYSVCDYRSYFLVSILVLLAAITITFQLQINKPDEHTCKHMFHQVIILKEDLSKIAATQEHCNELISSIWLQKLQGYGKMPNQVAPAIVKMSDYTEKMENKEEWFSNPFFAFMEGYQMCLRVDAGGHFNFSLPFHMGVFVYLMKGPHDDKLEESSYWPLRGIFKIELLNQHKDNDHYTRTIQQHHHI